MWEVRELADSVWVRGLGQMAGREALVVRDAWKYIIVCWPHLTSHPPVAGQHAAIEEAKKLLARDLP